MFERACSPTLTGFGDSPEITQQGFQFLNLSWRGALKQPFKKGNKKKRKYDHFENDLLFQDSRPFVETLQKPLVYSPACCAKFAYLYSQRAINSNLTDVCDT